MNDVLRLLGTVAKGSGEHLASLDLRGAFREWQAPHDNPRYVEKKKKKNRNTYAKIFCGTIYETVERSMRKKIVTTSFVETFGKKRRKKKRIKNRSTRVFGTSSRYLRLLSRFRALTLLKLDYPALSNHALNALANGASRTLKSLHVSVKDSDSRQHTIADAAWRNLALACPALTVSYTIGITECGYRVGADRRL